MQVSAEQSVDSAYAASGRRSSTKRPVNSDARCWLSAAEPPLPQNMTLPPARSASTVGRTLHVAGQRIELREQRPVLGQVIAKG